MYRMSKSKNNISSDGMGYFIDLRLEMTVLNIILYYSDSALASLCFNDYNGVASFTHQISYKV